MYLSKYLKHTGVCFYIYFDIHHTKGTSRQRSGKGAIRKRFPLQKPRWEKTKLTIRYLQYSQRDVYILRAHARKKKGLSSTQNPRKTLAHSSQNPRLFHAMSTFIPRKKRVSCVRYKQFHACSRFPRSLRKRSVERIKRHARKGLSSCSKG